MLYVLPTQNKFCLVSSCLLTCTHDLCFEQKYENSEKESTENCHFYSHEKSLKVAWACFRNDGSVV